MVGTAYPNIGYSATVPTDKALTWSPRQTPVGEATGIVLLHGAAAGAANPSAGWLAPSSGVTDTARLSGALAGTGRPMISPQGGVNGSASFDNFTNATALSIIDDAFAYLTGTLGAKTGKVILAAHSMGGAQAMAWARANPTKVACMILWQPLSDIQDLVTNNRGGYAADANAAYSGGYSDAVYGATGNPILFASQLAGIPCQFWYSTDDAIVLPSTVQAVMTAIGSSAELGGTGTGGHFTGLAAFPTAPMLAFMAKHLN